MRGETQDHRAGTGLRLRKSIVWTLALMLVADLLLASLGHSLTLAPSSLAPSADISQADRDSVDDRQFQSLINALAVICRGGRLVGGESGAGDNESNNKDDREPRETASGACPFSLLLASLLIGLVGILLCLLRFDERTRQRTEFTTRPKRGNAHCVHPARAPPAWA